MQTVFDMVRRASTRAPDNVAIVDPRRHIEISYSRLVQKIERIAAGFIKRGVHPGSRIAVALPNSIEACLTLLALHRAGAIPALMNPRLKPEEIRDLIALGEMQGAVLDPAFADAPSVRSGVAGSIFRVETEGRSDGLSSMENDDPPPMFHPGPEDAAFIFYTSGTTGKPKGVVLSQRAVESRVLFMVTQSGYRFGFHNRVIGLMPLYHVIGFFAVFVLALALNGRYYVIRDFRPDDTIDLIQTHRITGLFGTPTHLDLLVRSILATPRDLSSLETVTFAGATMPDSVLNRVNVHLPGRKTNIYGTTETMNSLFAEEPHEGTRLRPGFYSEVRVIPIGGSPEHGLPPGEEGELIIAADADATFTEYLNQPDATREKLQGGWYRTSDAAVMHPNGDIEIRGRLDDMIISGGENIHPSEVERVLQCHPNVHEAVVLGLPDERWGQRVVACIVARETSPTTSELDEFCAVSELASFKRPRAYAFLDEIPRNAMNKVLVKVLAQTAQASMVALENT